MGVAEPLNSMRQGALYSRAYVRTQHGVTEDQGQGFVVQRFCSHTAEPIHLGNMLFCFAKCARCQMCRKKQASDEHSDTPCRAAACLVERLLRTDVVATAWWRILHANGYTRSLIDHERPASDFRRRPVSPDTSFDPHHAHVEAWQPKPVTQGLCLLVSSFVATHRLQPNTPWTCP